MTLAQTLSEIRHYRSYTQREVSERCGLSIAYISDLERGKLDNPSLDTMKKLAEALGVSLRELLLGQDEEEILMEELEQSAHPTHAEKLDAALDVLSRIQLVGRPYAVLTEQDERRAQVASAYALTDIAQTLRAINAALVLR